jgi:hypothetical protein
MGGLYDNSSSGAPAGASARKTVLATGPGATLRCSGALRLGTRIEGPLNP